MALHQTCQLQSKLIPIGQAGHSRRSGWLPPRAPYHPAENAEFYMLLWNIRRYYEVIEKRPFNPRPVLRTFFKVSPNSSKIFEASEVRSFITSGALSCWNELETCKASDMLEHPLLISERSFGYKADKALETVCRSERSRSAAAERGPAIGKARYIKILLKTYHSQKTRLYSRSHTAKHSRKAGQTLLYRVGPCSSGPT